MVSERQAIANRVAALCVEPEASTPQQLAAIIESEAVVWTDVIKKNNIQEK